MMRHSREQQERKRTVVVRLKQLTGQAMIEYALILVLLAVAFGVALAATGPAIGNVFSNTIFQLLQQTPESMKPEVIGPVEFWRTVTAVAATDDSARERPIPTRTPAPPTNTPTLGPSPTPTPTIPTNTPIPSNTPPPTATPVDITRVAPYLDTADEPEVWRVNASVFIGTDDWCGDYYPSNDLTGTPIRKCNREFGRSFHGVLDFDWGELGPLNQWPGGAGNDGLWYNNFSVRYTKPIYLDPASWPVDVTEVGVVLNVQHDDGMRIKLGGTTIYDNWGSPNTASISVNIPVGTQLDLVVEYRENSGDAGLSVKVGIASNEADTAVDGSGAATGDAPDCNWGQRLQINDAYSERYMWDEYAGGDFVRSNRCYLEFRGAIYVPDTNGVPDPDTEAMLLPQLVFWDVWDMDNGDTRGWVEIAEYVDNPLGSGQVDYSAMTWQRIDLRQGDTANYNWTRNVIDLTNVNGVDFRGKPVALRFVMENRGGGGDRTWYIDDIEFRDAYDAALGGSELRDFAVGDYWNVDLAEQANDFIGSRNWQITCTDMSYGFGGSCSWEDSPGGDDYRDFSESPDWWPDSRDHFRVHYLEFKGWINIPANGLGDPDYEGDTGAGLLSFYHAYNLGRYTGLEVQYTTDAYGVGPANWQPVPGPDPANPVGVIRDRFEGSDTSRLVMEQELIPLGDIPANRFRLRFAMLVRGSAYLRDGWWIDEIRIEREGLPKYLDYPFFDGAEEGIQDWQTIGDWGRTNEEARTDDHSFTDSPGADNRYNNNADTALQFRWAIDLYNDTPGNLDLFDRNTAGGNSNPQNPGTIAPPAQNPVLSFYHRRDLTWSDNFHVEFRFATDPVNDWQHLWSYIHRMGTTRGEWSSRTETQLAWERVEIDLSVIMRQIGGDAPGVGTGDALRDDDVFIRFRLDTDGNNTDDGIWLDDIRIQERNEMVHRLWTMGTDPVIGGQNFGNGDGTRFFDDLDNGDWFNRWHRGGNWEAIEWEQNSGIYAFHESPDGQIAAPRNPDIRVIPGSPVRYEITDPPLAVDGDSEWNGSDAYDISSPDDTFHVLEMRTIIDLRAMLESDDPTLYFWNRYYPGRQDRISVEVSYELDGTQANIDSYMNDKCRSNGRLQCYEHIYGWSEWEEVWHMGEFEKAFGWEREAVDLSDYAAEDLDTPGKRIRIRFVYDALDNNDNRDGWYIDDIEVGPRHDDVVHILSLGGFFDGARDLSGWVTEGTWGLSPEFHRGDEGGAISLGVWQESWVDCDQCRNLAPSGTSWNDRFAAGADAFLDTDFAIPPNYVEPGKPSATYTGELGPVTRTVLDINYPSTRPRPEFNETGSYVGRWVLDTPVIGTGGVEAGEYSFVVYSDDGVRLKYEELNPDGTTTPISPNPSGEDFLEWNIIYYWSEHPPRPDIGVASFEAGKRYRITLEYFQNGGGAFLSLSVGGAAYSFTDSPKQGAGPAFPDNPAIRLGDTSLMLDGTIDLSDTDTPILQYYTYYEARGTLRVEVSTDGGITWRQNGLGGRLYDSNGDEFDSFDGASYDGEHLPGEEGDEWRLRRHKLTDYVGQQIMIRFRFDRRNWNDGRCINRDHGCGDSEGIPGGRFNENGWFISWWITDIEVADAGPIP